MCHQFTVHYAMQCDPILIAKSLWMDRKGTFGLMLRGRQPHQNGMKNSLCKRLIIHPSLVYFRDSRSLYHSGLLSHLNIYCITTSFTLSVPTLYILYTLSLVTPASKLIFNISSQKLLMSTNFGSAALDIEPIIRAHNGEGEGLLYFEGQGSLSEFHVRSIVEI